MNKQLQILDIRGIKVDRDLYNITAINRGGDPYWVEFIEPHFNEINVDIKILPLDEIDKTKKWFINVDINAWHWPECTGDVFESFGETVIKELNDGNAYLILNHQCESFTESFFRILYQKLQSYPSIPYNKIVYMVGAADAHREYNKFVKDYNIEKSKQIDIIYAHHIYKRFKYDNSLSFFNYDRTVKKEKKFLSLNRRWHDHRLLLVCSLAQQNLLEHGYVSLGVMPDEVLSASNQMDNIFRSRVDVNLFQEGFNKIKDQLPLQIDSVDLSINHFQSTSLPIEFYQKSYFSLVSSTCGFAAKEESVGFTEKEVKPIIAKHPFIIHNLPGVLKHLKNMGFLTFSPWFDESYDNELNDWERMNKIVKEVKRLSELSFDTWDRMLDEMEPVLEHNYNRMVNYTSEHCYFNSDLKNLLYYVS
jgi:hypothetical protein